MGKTSRRRRSLEIFEEEDDDDELGIEWGLEELGMVLLEGYSSVLSTSSSLSSLS